MMDHRLDDPYPHRNASLQSEISLFNYSLIFNDKVAAPHLTLKSQKFTDSLKGCAQCPDMTCASPSKTCTPTCIFILSINGLPFTYHHSKKSASRCDVKLGRKYLSEMSTDVVFEQITRSCLTPQKFPL